VKQVAEKHNVPAGVVAIAWTLANEGVTGAIVGARNASQVQETIAGAELKLTSEDMAVLLGK
jgi:aryl-alcohol dehydrogenase-like predicted oxidoreductase